MTISRVSKLEIDLARQGQQLEALVTEVSALRSAAATSTHEHDFIPMPGEPYEKRAADQKKMDPSIRYLSFYCRRCPATHEAIAADFRSKGGG